MQRSPLAIIFFTVFIDLVGFGIVLPLLPYYAEQYGASPFLVGALSTSYSLMQFVFMPVWGRLSDRHGRRPLILLSLAGSCVGFLIFGLASSLPVLFAGRMIAGIAGAIIPTTNAYIADVTTPEQRAKGMGMVGAAFGLGFILGPAIGGLLAPYGYDKPVLLASAMAGANLVFAYFKLPESLSRENRGRVRSGYFSRKRIAEAMARPSMALLMALYFLVIFAFANMEATFGLLNEHRYGLDARRTGYLFAYFGLLMVLVQGMIVGRLVQAFGESILMTAGTFCMIIGLASMPFAPGMPAYCAVIALLSFGAGINNPSITALISRSSGIDEQGGIMGIAQSLASLGRILGPLWGGYTFGEFGEEWPFLSGAILMSFAFILSLVYRRRHPGVRE